MFKLTNYHKRALSVALVTCVVLFAGASPALAQVAPSLGTAESFAVLGGQTVTNTGPTVVDGDLGVSPGSAVTGFPPGSVTGTIHRGDAVAAQAQADASDAYDSLAGQACDTDLTGQDLGGMTLTPGVYCFSSSAQLTGTLTLDAQGNPDAVFIFQIGSTLTTASGSSVVLINGGSPCNVFWQVGSSATLGTDTTFLGTIIALQSITLNTGADILSGRALALNGSVTMHRNNVSVVPCGQPTPTGPGNGGPGNGGPGNGGPGNGGPGNGGPGNGGPGNGGPGNGGPGPGVPSGCPQIQAAAAAQGQYGDASADSDASAGDFASAANAEAVASIAQELGITQAQVNACLGSPGGTPTVPPTTSTSTAPPTTSSSTAPPTTSSSTAPPTTSSSTAPPTTSSSASASASAAAAELPESGGSSLFALGAGALLVAGGLMARRIVR
jgi:Ice-binding-like